MSEEDMVQILVMKRTKIENKAANTDAESACSSSGSSRASGLQPSAVRDMETEHAESGPPAEGEIDNTRADA